MEPLKWLLAGLIVAYGASWLASINGYTRGGLLTAIVALIVYLMFRR